MSRFSPRPFRVRHLLFLLCVLGVCGGAHIPDPSTLPDPDPRSNQRPNILIFVADDAGWRDFGAYGNEVIRTPNVDHLAETGLTFERAFLTTPQCSPSRISILTGKYPHATGAEDLHMNLPEDEVMVPSYLQSADYFSGHMRKTHYGPNGREQFQWYSKELSSAFPDFLDARKGQPFFLWVGFRDPHRPYSENAIDNPHDPSNVLVPPYLADTPATRRDLANYYDEISRMDSQIGRFVDVLERRDLRENTLIVFLSDNGAPFPRAKGSLYDAGIRTPLIFSWPAGIEGGVRTDGLASVIDLAPTLLDVAGVTRPDSLQGHSIKSVLDDPSTPGREFVFSERNWHDTDAHMRSLRTERYKLITNGYPNRPFPIAADIGDSPAWFSLLQKKRAGTLNEEQAALFQFPRPAVEVYDVQKDPWEFHNLAGTARRDSTIDRLTQRLHRWKEETGDFPPTRRTRADHTDRVTGVWYRHEVPPMRNDD